MKETKIAIPQIGLIAATRGMLGAGIGLLISSRMKADTRKAVGLTLLGVGLVTTVPLVMQVIGGSRGETEGSAKPSTPALESTWESREARRSGAAV